MPSLTDITIYNLFDPIEVPESEKSVFPSELRFVCELYHENMNGYKPEKTSRICIDIATEKKDFEPWYFGAICHCSRYFDKNKYFDLDKESRYLYIAKYVHEALVDIANKRNWDTAILDEAYDKTKHSKFKNLKIFPLKSSPDKLKTGQAILEKTEEGRIILSFKINSIHSETKVLIDKLNFYPIDFTNKIAKNTKWIDNNTFGYKDTKSERTIYYNLLTKKRFRNFKMREEDNPNPD